MIENTCHQFHVNSNNNQTQNIKRSKFPSNWTELNELFKYISNDGNSIFKMIQSICLFNKETFVCKETQAHWETCSKENSTRKTQNNDEKYFFIENIIFLDGKCLIYHSHWHIGTCNALQKKLSFIQCCWLYTQWYQSEN